MNVTLLANRPVLTQARGKMARDNGQTGTATVGGDWQEHQLHKKNPKEADRFEKCCERMCAKMKQSLKLFYWIKRAQCFITRKCSNIFLVPLWVCETPHWNSRNPAFAETPQSRTCGSACCRISLSCVPCCLLDDLLLWWLELLLMLSIPGTEPEKERNIFYFAIRTRTQCRLFKFQFRS